ncbi:LytTR family DNA-binding domain-containing protein [Dyadobacter sp. CY343]|jgi:two-component system LytT family response regulator|uniref:LytR/AlgR family response regulator transcription factor n=1 Tax=Dyadobacter sp. CY343 TaxID=2907299 RepID=UPI001F35955F|nr:LytTR family DNA-binding domain-containing protein [Dyadobacter sp. CY343]MCE7061471.1 LytTR family transcriptional regulator [Dyadobacter sp. CY343]
MKNYTPFTRTNLVERTYSDSRSSISVQSMGRTIYLTPDVITFLEGEGNYTFIYTNTGKKYLVSKTLKSLAELLNPNFMRVHKSYLVNADYIVERMEDDRMLKLSCGKEVAVSRRKIKEVSGFLDHTSLQISA